MVMPTLTRAYAQITKNRRLLERYFAAISQTSNIKHLIRLCKYATVFAAKSSTGYYAAPIIEQALLKIAQTIPSPSAPSTTPQGVLHVMTRCYEAGGHTRVVERWIAQAPAQERHSLCFTARAQQEIPSQLRAAIQERNGTITLLPDHFSDMEKGEKLRHLALQFERIVLHVHMHDIIPTLAFGTPEFPRPVIHYNHADHCFWMGVSIADVIAELRHSGAELSRQFREATRQHIIGLPLDVSMLPHGDKQALREKLCLPMDKKIIFTCGSSYKFKPIEGMDFLPIITTLLKQYPDMLCIAIGPGYKLKGWKKTAQQFPGRFISMDRVPPGLLYAYAQAADLVLDSIPMNGGIALMDMIRHGCPALTLRSPLGHMDYLLSTRAYCKDADELIEKTSLLLENPELARAYFQELQQALNTSVNAQPWNERVASLYHHAGTKHQLQSLDHPILAKNISGLDAYLYASAPPTWLWRNLFAVILWSNVVVNACTQIFIRARQGVMSPFS